MWDSILIFTPLFFLIAQFNGGSQNINSKNFLIFIFKKGEFFPFPTILRLIYEQIPLDSRIQRNFMAEYYLRHLVFDRFDNIYKLKKI